MEQETSRGARVRAARLFMGVLGVIASAYLAGCGPGPGGTGITVSFPPDDNTTITFRVPADFIPVSGRFQYQDVFVDDDDILAGVQTAIRPVRAADVGAVDAETGAEVQLATVATDDNGNFTVFVPNSRTFFLILKASIGVRSDRARVNILTEPFTNSIYIYRFGRPDANTPFDPTNVVSFFNNDYVIPVVDPLDADERPSAPFNILDSVLTAADQLRIQTLTAPLPPLNIYWNVGIPVGTFFSETIGPGGTPAIVILGGDSNTMNTDEFDDAVIQHEFGHFVAASTSRDSSLGGSHRVDDKLYLSLAWSEGFANFFSGFARGKPVLTNTQRITGSPLISVIGLEDTPLADPGPDVELTIAEVLWDLADGALSGFPDSDLDGVSVALRNVFLPFFDLRTQAPPPYVDVYEYLINLTNRGILSVAQLNTLLNVTPKNQGIPFPPGAADIFPQPITVNGLVVDDNCITRAEGDGQRTGVDVSNRFRIFTLAAPTRITVTVTNTTIPLPPGITGQNASGTNLEHQVRTVDNDLAINLDTGLPLTPIGQRELAIESESGLLAAGTYVIYVNGIATDPLTGNLSNASSQANSYLLQVTSP